MKSLGHIDMHCFACGPLNGQGLKMDFASDGEKLYSTVRVPPHLRGWHNLVHGGIITTMLDEIMSWTAICLRQRFILTKNITASFKKPIFVETEIHVEGYVEKEIDDRNLVMGARIMDGDGRICACSTGEFVLFTPDEFNRMEFMDKEIVEEMQKMFYLYDETSQTEKGR